jgi:signal peptidase I
VVAAVALASYVFIRHYLLRSVEVVGVSMSPTLRSADRYLLNLCVYRVRAPQPSEIVVLRDPQDQSYAIKRVVACEGDVVSVKDGHLFVNGRELNEPYLRRGIGTFAPIRQEERSWRCGKNEYFVLGDNRDNSTDSRVYGAVPRQNILGAIIR